MEKNSVSDCYIIHLNKINNIAGNMTVIEEAENIPFPIKRVYYLYDIPKGGTRGGHAHICLYQLIISIGGSFSILLDDGTNKRLVKLDNPSDGLIIVPGIWRELLEFSSGSICLVLASEKYDEKDYIRNYSEFVNYCY